MYTEELFNKLKEAWLKMDSDFEDFKKLKEEVDSMESTLSEKDYEEIYKRVYGEDGG